MKEVIVNLELVPFLLTRPEYVHESDFDGLDQDKIIGYYNEIPIKCNVPLEAKQELKPISIKEVNSILAGITSPILNTVDGIQLFYSATEGETTYLKLNEKVLDLYF